MNTRSSLKINSCCLSYYSVSNCSDLVTICNIPNVFGETGQQIHSIINTEIAVLHTINLKSINTSSDNLVTTFINPSYLKDSPEYILYDSSSRPNSVNSLSSSFASTINVISVPLKIWSPKKKNNYKPMICTNVYEDLYIFKSYGKTMKRSKSWTPRSRSDVIPWNTPLCQQELDNNFNIGSMTDVFTRKAVLHMIKDNWDYFCDVRSVQLILDFEFFIDTGNAKATCCRQSKYSVHEAKIMSKQISDLENNKCIRDYTGPWGTINMIGT